MALEYTPNTPTASWEEAYRDFLMHLQATKAPKTVQFYNCQLRQLLKWTNDNPVTLDSFGKRQLDRYLADRAQTVSRTTLRHDAVATKAFFKWCAKNDLILRSPLADYEIKAAPRPNKYMPTDSDMQLLLKAVRDYWDTDKHPQIQYLGWNRRLLHRERNYALILLLLDSAARIGEIAGLSVDDYRAREKQIVIRESKGKEPRVLPLSPSVVDALTEWLRIRAKLMANVPKSDDPGYLFLSEYGTAVDTSRFLKALKAMLRFANLSDDITLHSLRRYSLNKLAKNNLLSAQAIAGHKNPQTTLLYTKLDPDFIREMHSQVAVVDNVLENRRTARKKRLL